MRDIKYIIKRIIIGVGIALVLMYLKGGIALQVHANQISPYNALGYSEDIGSNSASVIWDVPGDPWKSHGNGILRFSFAINKTSGASTDPVITPRLVRAYNGNTIYVCNFGSTYATNSTWTGQSYSVECPMNMDANGLTEILVAFLPFSQQNTSYYKISFPPDMSFEVYEGTSVNVQVDTSSINNSINNQITNDNSNTQSIINNQNDNTQQQIESQKVCNTRTLSNSLIFETGALNGTNGTVNSSSSNFGVSDFISLSEQTNTLKLVNEGIGQTYSCFYNSAKNYVSCFKPQDYQVNDNIPVPTGAKYLRITFSKSYSRPVFDLTSCQNGNQAIADGQQQINDTLNNDNVDGATSQAESFFDDFQSDSHGLSGIITAPLRLITSLSSSTCTSLSIPLPFVQTNATLPCMSTIYSTYFPTFLSLYQLITTGLIGYWVLIKIFGHVKGMQDPKDDRIEVLDL